MPKKLGEDIVLYDVEELSKSLTIQERTIRALLREGKIKGRKLAKKWYVTENALQEYFRQHEPDINKKPVQAPAKKILL